MDPRLVELLEELILTEDEIAKIWHGGIITEKELAQLSIEEIEALGLDRKISEIIHRALRIRQDGDLHELSVGYLDTHRRF